MTKTSVDADEALITRALALLKHDKGAMTGIAIARILGEDSSTIFRLLGKREDVETARGAGWTTFQVKG